MSVTTISGCPSAAPRSTTCTLSANALSLRQFVSRVEISPRSRAPQVGDDVAAAEPVDRLFGIADEDQRRRAAERPPDDVPLYRVGVLELVDHHDGPARPHPLARGGVVALQRGGQPAQQVVEAKDGQPALAAFEFAAHVVRERAPARASVPDRDAAGAAAALGSSTAARATRRASGWLSSVACRCRRRSPGRCRRRSGGPHRRGSRPT